MKGNLIVIFGFSNVKAIRITRSEFILLPTAVFEHLLQMNLEGLKHTSKLLVPESDYDTFSISTELLWLKFKIRFNLIELIRAGSRGV